MQKREIKIKDVLTFSSGEIKFAIPLKYIDKVIAAQEITPVEKQSGYVKGIIDLKGEIIPVISLRSKFSIEEREINPSDTFVILFFLNSKIALISEENCEIVSIPDDSIKDIKTIFNGLSSVKLVNGKSGIMYIYDPETFLSKDESIEVIKLWEGTIQNNL
ncbi:MAG: chemotaxis protein CheW [Bacteroidales bacterium]